MPVIVKKGTNPSAFRLSKRTVVCEPDIVTVITDEELAEIKQKFGGFLEPRIITEKNPFGCFIISERSTNYTEGFNKEVGKVEDGSTPLQMEKIKRKKRK